MQQPCCAQQSMGSLELAESIGSADTSIRRTSGVEACLMLTGNMYLQKAEQAAMSKQVVVPKKFRKRVLDPDERYEQERARMEAAKVQRAAQVSIQEGLCCRYQQYTHGRAKHSEVSTAQILPVTPCTGLEP